MTYVPPERDDGEALDQTQKLVTAPAAQSLPAVGNGDLGGQAAPFQPEASPTVPFASDRGETETDSPYGVVPARTDRLAAQFIWEAVLAVLTVGALCVVFFLRRDEVFGDTPIIDVLDANLSVLAPVLLVAVALGLSLRFGVVNLAVVSLMPFVTAYPGVFVGSSPAIGLAFTAGLALLVTVVFVLLVLVLRVPPWLAGLAVAIGLFASRPIFGGGIFGYEPSADPASWALPSALVLMGGVAVVAVAGGLLGLLPRLRDRMSAVKDAMDGTGERDAATVFTFIGVAFVSSLLAAAAGFLIALFRDTEVEQLEVYAATPFGITTVQTLAFVVLFLGGTSPKGRRGGVFGGLLAALLFLALYMLWASYVNPAVPNEARQWSSLIIFGLLALGLVAAGVLDRLGRPKERPAPPQDIQPFEPQPDVGLFDPEPTADPR